LAARGRQSYLAGINSDPMKIIILLIVLSLTIAFIFLIAFFWAVGTGQYDDEVTPSIRILFDNNPPSTKPTNDEQHSDA
jgi:cbb3-type cytochrome oxidase maturation protein